MWLFFSSFVGWNFFKKKQKILCMWKPDKLILSSSSWKKVAWQSSGSITWKPDQPGRWKRHLAPDILIQQFMFFVGLPRRIRADYGTENVSVAIIQRFLRSNHDDTFANEKSFLFGKSTSNQVISILHYIILYCIALISGNIAKLLGNILNINRNCL